MAQILIKIDKNKSTPELLAIKRTSPLTFVTSLIKYAVDLNVKNSNGKTALEISLSVNK